MRNSGSSCGFHACESAGNIEIPIVKILRESVLGAGFAAWVSNVTQRKTATRLVHLWLSFSFLATGRWPRALRFQLTPH